MKVQVWIDEEFIHFHWPETRVRLRRPLEAFTKADLIQLLSSPPEAPTTKTLAEIVAESQVQPVRYPSRKEEAEMFLEDLGL